MDISGRHPDTELRSVPCPTCGEPVDVTARLHLWPDPRGFDGRVAHIVIDLDPAREHAKRHPEAMPAALAHFGVPW